MWCVRRCLKRPANGRGLGSFLLLPVPDKSSVPSWGEEVNDCLPAWAYSAEVETLVKDYWEDPHFAGGIPPLTCTSGPAVMLGFWALAILWLFFCVAPWIAFKNSSCPENEGFAQCSEWWLFLSAGIVMMVSGGLQKLIMPYVIISQLGVTKRFCLLGFSFNKCPYFLFFFVMTVFMCGCHLDTMTNAETLGKTLRTKSCKSYDEISWTWDITMRESTFAIIPGFRGVAFDNIVLYAYMLMAAQPIFALMCSIPIERNVSYEVGFGDQYKFEYKTVYEWQFGTNHGKAVQIVAEAANLQAVTFQDFKYAECRMEAWKTGQSQGWELRYIDLARAQVKRGVSRFFLRGLLQTAIQVNIQISLMALTKKVTGVLDLQLLMSVIVTVVLALGDLPDAYQVAQLAWRARGLLLGHTGNIADEQYRDKVRRGMRSILWKLLRLVFYIILYLFMLWLAIFKILGFFACENHLINVNGCVTMPEFPGRHGLNR